MEEGRWEDPGGVICPCCDQRAKVYRRKLNAEMARALIVLYRHHLSTGEEWVHVPTVLAAQGGDPIKMVAWGLIEALPDATRWDGSSRVGVYRVTPDGQAFVLGVKRVASHVLIYNQDIIGISEETTDIREALGVRFNYAELMQPAVAP
jgi:hypothetical protein